LGVGASYQGALADTAELSAIVVTATRVAQSSVDLPVSVDRVDRRAIADGQLQVNLSESLITVPGVSVQSRQNYAQDLQLSVRGFGARSSFGVRGIRLYSDGIPGTMPDGQGQFSQFDLGSADHIEVLRGPFSALYGNSSGGVIAIFTEDAKPGYLLDGKAEYGTFNTQRYALKTEGDDRVVNYVVDAAHFQTDGYRFHSSLLGGESGRRRHVPREFRGQSLWLIRQRLRDPDSERSGLSLGRRQPCGAELRVETGAQR
jgi:iron complex outermembrane receptor protein